ncbi:hypothetical protein OC842_006983 [Tilletia horrida]|uniref:AB hydrolase-1 domain-containing protein n=1 Tax=Tilletia horrida TaxID=155126 RepID=A0AAN6G510_9BASI|nr:hypothetical protein OC842_006983 [Tilletia horrida]
MDVQFASNSEKAELPLPLPRPQRPRRRLSGVDILQTVIVLAALYQLIQPWLQTRAQPKTGQHPHAWSHIQPHYPASRSGPFHWVPCFPNPARGTNQHKWKCGYLDTPLDYTNTSDARTARIALVLYQAGKHKSERTIVINPGGPGGSGTGAVFRMGEKMSETFSDGTMDVLGFDPRGVNMTAPQLVCGKSEAYNDRFRLLAGSYPDAANGGQYNAHLADAYAIAQWKACEDNSGDLLRFLSTTFVARDVDEIRKALGEDELTALVYSYGTHLMQEYAALFPQRVGRIVQDGVQFARNAQSMRGLAHTSLGNVTEIWELGFISGCVKSGSKGCALISKGEETTTDKLKKRMDGLLARIREHPVPATHPEIGAGVITYEWMMSILFHASYKPDSWPLTAQILAELERDGNGTLALQAGSFTFDPRKQPHEGWHEWRGVHFPPTVGEEVTQAVLCGDAFNGKGDAGNLDSEELYEFYQRASQTHRISAGMFFDMLVSCRSYPPHLAPAEAYRGNFTARLRNPLLLVGPTYDPVTPLFNSREAAVEWGSDNVKVVVHNGFGHASLAQPSKCTDAVIRDVILHGKWPSEAEVQCEADQDPFPHPTENAEGQASRQAALRMLQAQRVRPF